jgi:hypothetical protein
MLYGTVRKIEFAVESVCKHLARAKISAEVKPGTGANDLLSLA